MRARWMLAVVPVFVTGGAFFACSDNSSTKKPPVTTTSDAKTDGAEGGDAGCIPVPSLLPPPPPDTGDGAVDGDAVADTAEVDTTPAPVGGACNCPKLSETKLGGACNAVAANWPDEGHSHFEPGTPIVYCTKPPSSGFHYWLRAQYTTSSKPMLPGYLVPAMAPGAVIFLYKCDKSCPETEKKLQDVIDALPIDKSCIDPDAGPPEKQPLKRRVILVPEPTLDTEVAAAAWQWTYRATCVDGPTLTAFYNAHYNHAIEDTCADGFDPSGGGSSDGGMP